MIVFLLSAACIDIAVGISMLTAGLIQSKGAAVIIGILFVILGSVFAAVFASRVMP